MTYGGIELVVAVPPLVQWLEQWHPLDRLAPFTHPQQPHHLPLPFRPACPKPEINTLVWPTGASRWATGWYLVAEQDLESIRALAYASDTYTALTLSLDDGTYQVETSMWMLPPIPLAQIPTGADMTGWTLPETAVWIDAGQTVRQNGLYLMPLVDDRYFWWDKAADITIDEGTTTWATLFAAYGTALGVTIEHETVEAAYLTPTRPVGSRYGRLPMDLDAAAWAVGRRVVRALDGTVTLQRPDAAKTSQEAQLAIGWSRTAGGLFAMESQ